MFSLLCVMGPPPSLTSPPLSLPFLLVNYAHPPDWTQSRTALLQRRETGDSFPSRGESRDVYCPAHFLTTTDQQIKLLLGSRTGAATRMMRRLIRDVKRERENGSWRGYASSSLGIGLLSSSPGPFLSLSLINAIEIENNRMNAVRSGIGWKEIEGEEWNPVWIRLKDPYLQPVRLR